MVTTEFSSLTGIRLLKSPVRPEPGAAELNPPETLKEEEEEEEEEGARPAGFKTGTPKEEEEPSHSSKSPSSRDLNLETRSRTEDRLTLDSKPGLDPDPGPRGQEGLEGEKKKEARTQTLR